MLPMPVAGIPVKVVEVFDVKRITCSPWPMTTQPLDAKAPALATIIDVDPAGTWPAGTWNPDVSPVGAFAPSAASDSASTNEDVVLSLTVAASFNCAPLAAVRYSLRPVVPGDRPRHS